MRSINLIVIHCAATPNGKSMFRSIPGRALNMTPVEVVDEMHRARGFARTADFRARQNPELTSIGYHFLIYTNGAVVTGRHLEEVGAHVRGFNSKSIGICMLGTDEFTAAQWKSLAVLVHTLSEAHPAARVCGHRDLSPDQNKNGIVEPFEWLKTCPGFDVAAWRRNDMTPLPKNIYVAPDHE